MVMIPDSARQVVRKWRTRHQRPVAPGNPELRQRIDALGTWFQNFDLNGTPTKLRSIVGEPYDYPRAAWHDCYRLLVPELRGKTVLDIGCNAGYFSVECKRLGAERVLGVDVSQGTQSSFIAQARFAASELGEDVEYREMDFMDLRDGPFDVVLFIGVLYHLDDPIAGLRKAAAMARQRLIVETRVFQGRKATIEFKRGGWDDDVTSPWVPTPRLVDELLLDAGAKKLTRPRLTTRRRYVVAADW